MPLFHPYLRFKTDILRLYIIIIYHLFWVFAVIVPIYKKKRNKRVVPMITTTFFIFKNKKHLKRYHVDWIVLNTYQEQTHMHTTYIDIR